jgi:hypothetical protein
MRGVFTDVRVLATDTVRVCWRLFPQILAIYLLGWLTGTLALKIAVIVGDVSAWAALAIFAFSFLSTLVAIVLILRLVGRELGIWSMLPAEESVTDGRDASLTRMLAVTLLPFLGLYAAFGQVNEAAGGLYAEQLYRNSVFGPASVLTVVRDLATNHPWRLLLVLLGIYIVRRALDIAHERTEIRVFGLAVALMESFFILVVIFGGFVLFRRGTDWLGDRAFNGWIDDLHRGFSYLLSLIHAQLPELVDRAVGFVSNQIWPVLWPVVSQPIIWLAVASLVFGSQVLSLAELWRKGQPIATRVPGASKFARRADKLALRRIGPPPQGVARVASELKEVFLGDVDDKYLPTFHSIRLVLRAGAVFLGSYVMLYTAIVVVQNALTWFVHFLAGGRQVDFWYINDPLVELLKNVPWELLRICLLAAAFRRCLEVFRVRGQRDDGTSVASDASRSTQSSPPVEAPRSVPA